MISDSVVDLLVAVYLRLTQANGKKVFGPNKNRVAPAGGLDVFPAAEASMDINPEFELGKLIPNNTHQLATQRGIEKANQAEQLRSSLTDHFWTWVAKSPIGFTPGLGEQACSTTEAS